MLLPFFLIGLAVAAAAAVAYGTDPDLARFSHGIQIIMLTRRLQWPLVILCMFLCVGLIALIISGRRRAWWLTGLAIVLALFARAFSSFYRPSIAMVESPPFVDPAQSGGILQPAQYVAGFEFAGQHYALPFQQMTAHPLLLLNDQEQRAVVIWSVTANAATVLPIDRTVFPREWEVASRPADSLLLYDRRLGQFIVGVTGKTVQEQRPAGTGDPLGTELVPYQQWLGEHPDTRVMNLDYAPAAPATPVQPLLHFPADRSHAQRTVAVLSTSQPSAVESGVTMHYQEITIGKTSLLLIRLSAAMPLRAFDRQTKDDLVLRLSPLKRPDKKHPAAVLVDSDSNSLWTSEGHAIEGPLKGTQLREVGVRDGLSWSVMKFWMPSLEWVESK